MGAEISICGSEASKNRDILKSDGNNPVLDAEKELRQQIEESTTNLSTKLQNLQKSYDDKNAVNEEHNKTINSQQTSLEESQKKLTDLLENYEKILELKDQETLLNTNKGDIEKHCEQIRQESEKFTKESTGKITVLENAIGILIFLLK